MKAMALQLPLTASWSSLLFLIIPHLLSHVACDSAGFVQTSGTQFVVHGHPFYVNGFNAYYMSYVSADPNSRPMISQLLKSAAAAGLTVGRTWAFNDGGYHALQISPGVYDETSFRAMDFVINEAKTNGIRLVMSLSNNYPSMGGKAQYVQWARNAGVSLSSDDAFFSDPTVKGYFKDNIKAVLTRVNTITGVAYKDDPTIFAWELMNEPRCTDDPSGKTLQAWIQEMAPYVKAIDSIHLLEVGLEGFYGSSTPSKLELNAGVPLGTDFLVNNQVAGIDFATVHSYPDQWFPSESLQTQLSFLTKWVNSHIEDGNNMGKPVLFAEFGLSTKNGNSVADRDLFLSTMYSTIYDSASHGGAGAGGLLWQLLPESLASTHGDGYQIDLSRDPSTASLIAAQSQKLSALNQMRTRKLLTWRRNWKTGDAQRTDLLQLVL